MSTPGIRSTAPQAPQPPASQMPQEQKWWRADIRIVHHEPLPSIIRLAFGFFQSIILNILTTPPNEGGAPDAGIRREQQLLQRNVLVAYRLRRAVLFWLAARLIGGLPATAWTIWRFTAVAVFWFKKNRTIRLESVQSVDISRPLVARLLGLSELRFEVADGSSEALHIKYVSARKAEVLRRTAMASINLLRSEGDWPPRGRAARACRFRRSVCRMRISCISRSKHPMKPLYGAPAQDGAQPLISSPHPSRASSSPAYPAAALACRCQG